ncbi:MAG: hypothetical protein CMQ38_00395 [Gammaproteobacteria bacterium]|nr:hypothetical protein [Gammaproteobacteria bacterium]
MNESHQQLAILGLDRQATEFYQRYLQEYLEGHETTLKNSTAHVFKADFEELNPYLPDNYAELVPRLEKILGEIDLQNCRALLIPNITLHTILPRVNLDPKFRNRIINPISCALDYLQQCKLGEITLAATRHTMLGTQLSDFFSSNGIRIQVPAAQDVQLIDAIRLRVFTKGAEQALTNQLRQVLSRYPHVLLACTELSMLNDDEVFMDMARMQIQAAASA